MSGQRPAESSAKGDRSVHLCNFKRLLVELVATGRLRLFQARDGNPWYDAPIFFCPDIDECSVANVCPAQLCLNNPGSYTCRSCEAGLQLSEDGHSCEGKPFSFHCGEPKSQ